MKKKYIELSVPELQARLKEKPTRYRKVKDSDIDFSDMPASTPEQLRKFKRVGRPLIGRIPRKSVHIRIDQDVLSKIKEKAKKKDVPYQSLINELLKKAI